MLSPTVVLFLLEPHSQRHFPKTHHIFSFYYYPISPSPLHIMLKVPKLSYAEAVKHGQAHASSSSYSSIQLPKSSTTKCQDSDAGVLADILTKSCTFGFGCEANNAINVETEESFTAYPNITLLPQPGLLGTILDSELPLWRYTHVHALSIWSRSTSFCEVVEEDSAHCRKKSSSDAVPVAEKWIRHVGQNSVSKADSERT